MYTITDFKTHPNYAQKKDTPPKIDKDTRVHTLTKQTGSQFP